MDYGALPPEINSARMYAGPGAGSMLAAADAWRELAAELRLTAVSYSSVISGLTGGWVGPSSARMAAASASYTTWLTSTAAHAEQTAYQARAAAAAYETAFAATVPPPVIAANRTALATLISTNMFGRNAAAIAANEALYTRMWAQDSAAMYRYAAQSATAATVVPFDPPPHNTSPAGTADQAGAVPQAVGTSAGTSAQSVLSQLTSVTPGVLQGLAAPTATNAPSLVSTLTSSLASLNSSPLATLIANAELIPKIVLPANDALVSTIMGLAIGGRALSDVAAAGAGAGASLAMGLGPAASTLASAGTAGVESVSVSVGQAGHAGGLAVPPSWSAATPMLRTVAALLADTGASAVSAAAVSRGALVTGAAVAGMAGGSLGSIVPALARAGDAPGAVSVKDHKELKDGDPPQDLRRVVAEMAEKAVRVQHWHTDPEHVDDLLVELRRKPGIHAVHVKGGRANVVPPKSQWT